MKQQKHYSHNMSDTLKERIVGVFVLVGLALFFAVFILNSQQLHLFEDHTELKLKVKSAEGISKDTPVRVAGLQVGRVNSVTMNDDHELEVSLRVYERYLHLVRQDSHAFVARQSLIGRPLIDISLGNPRAAEVQAGQFLPVSETATVEELTARAMPILDNVDRSLQRVTELLAVAEPTEVASIFQNLAHITEDTRAITQGLRAGEGMAGALLTDAALQQQLITLVQQGSDLMAGLHTTLQQLEPALARTDSISADIALALSQLPQMMQQSEQLLTQMNVALALVNREAEAMPEMLDQAKVLMNHTEQLLERLTRLRMFAKDEEPGMPLLEIRAYE